MSRQHAAAIAASWAATGAELTGSYARLAFDAWGDDVEFYVWPAELRATSARGQAAMHAKCAVADGRIAFVTSANLTGHGISENMELGLLVERDQCPGASPATLRR